jgi:adenylate cyclase
MSSKPSFSLRLSLAATLILTVLLTSVLLSAALYGFWRGEMQDALETRLEHLITTAALFIDPAEHAHLTQVADMQAERYQRLRSRLLEVQKANPDVRFFYSFRWDSTAGVPRFVLDTGEGQEQSLVGETYTEFTPRLRDAFLPPYKTRVESTFSRDTFGTWLSAYAPILNADGSLEGVLGLDVDAGFIRQIEYRQLFLLVGLTFCVLMLMGMLSLLLSRYISRPLLSLSQEMAQVHHLQLDTTLDTGSRISEIQTMESSLDGMKSGLKSFKKYVPADLVVELIALGHEAKLGAEKREMSIFFCDLQNFTATAECLDPQQLSRLIASYFETVTTTVQEHGGVIDKFIGDAVMAFWGAPRPLADHATLALKAALLLQKRLAALALDWQAQGLPGLATRMGLTTGTVLVGNVGHEHRLSYTALGDVVNLASRLESLNRYYGTQLLVTTQVLEAQTLAVASRPVDLVAVKGKQQGVLILEVALTAPDWWSLYLQGWDAYKAQDWRKAKDSFDQLLKLQPKDGPSQVLAERCANFIAQGVPINWSGVWVMEAK